MLGIQAAALLLHGAERAAHSNGWQFALGILGDIKVSRQSNTKKIGKGDLAVIDEFRLGEGFVPFLGEIQGVHILVLVAAEQHHCCKG